MREIKFRAWDKNKKEMIDVYSLDFLEGGNLTGIGTNFDGSDGKIIQDVEIMQYTGLKDKNSKEIYEGDILICKTYQDSEEILEVEFKNNGWFPINEMKMTPYRIVNVFVEYKIIGNIYENK